MKSHTEEHKEEQGKILLQTSDLRWGELHSTPLKSVVKKIRACE